MKNVTYINAGAGSGKTYKLTETLTELIENKKVKPEEVILTTFTTKAANEFKEKAKEFLFKKCMFSEAVQLDHAMIGTVHSVCQRMIGKYWFVLGLSPDMGVMTEEDTAFYISQSLAELPSESELKLLHGFAREFDLREKDGFTTKLTIDYNFWQNDLKRIIDYATNYELDDFTESENKSLEYIRQFVEPNCNCSFTYKELKSVVDEHEAFLRSQRQSDANDKRINILVQARHNLQNPTIAGLIKIASTIGIPKKFGPLAADFADRMEGVWSSELVYQKQETYIKLLFSLAKRWKENFAQFKREKNLLDYNDMEKYMRMLLEKESITNEISQSYRYLFVDEFQDSSPIQVKIFDALSDLMEHSYWVGDYKQAIYGFRGSDIALTKAVVDRVAKKQDGCDTDRLDKSWRSLPDIVDVNNNIFEKTFASALDCKNIHLNKVRENEANEDSLRYFVPREDAGIAEHILKLLNQGAQPNEVAVLARTNAELAKVAGGLSEKNIPSSRVDFPVVESAVYSLVASLLRIVVSHKDTLSLATVAFLTEQDHDTRKIIESKLLYDDNSAEAQCFLANIPLIKQLLKIRSRLMQQSVASLVESLIVELDLYDVIKLVEADYTFGISCLQTIINNARACEEHSVQMNLPATIGGFLSYIEEMKPVGNGNPDGVQLHTYHSCKGLQWKYVILMSLNTDVSDIKKSVRNEAYGVHAIHEVEPSAEHPYPDVYIRLTPWIYGTAHNVPDKISDKIEAFDSFKLAHQSMLAEANRIFYVGMTRPTDVLILSIDSPKRGATLLKWPVDCGLDKAISDAIPASGSWDVFHTDNQFKDFTLTDSELVGLKLYTEKDETIAMQLNIGEPTFEKLPPRYLSPSKIHAKGNVTSNHSFENRIPFAKQPSDMAIVGDCIHQIFAGIEELRPAYKIDMGKIIASYGLKGVLVDQTAVVRAWENLVKYLTETNGGAVKIFHERPFRLERDGQTVVGSIDLVWQTADGDILVDFKTCPMGANEVLNPDSEHYAGWYAGQLDAYQDALEAAGEKVLGRYIYYPVSGLLAVVPRVV